MSQRENFFPVENAHDRRKDSKYEVGDFIQERVGILRNKKGDIRWEEPRNFVIYEKPQLEDKQGLYWVYDIFFPDDNSIRENYKLKSDIKSYIRKHTKLG